MCICTFYNIFPDNSWLKKEIIMKIRKIFELNDNKNISYLKLWNAGKMVF